MDVVSAEKIKLKQSSEDGWQAEHSVTKNSEKFSKIKGLFKVKSHQDKNSLNKKRVARDINGYHEALCHPSKTITHATAKKKVFYQQGSSTPVKIASLERHNKPILARI